MMRKFICIGLLLCSTIKVFSQEYHVAVNGNDSNAGSKAKPFKTINHAARLAKPGDTVTVHAGIYREWINPKNGGTGNDKRITYRAAKGEKVEIKGSEVVKGWKQVNKEVWKVTLPIAFFDGNNTCAELVYGDWCYNENKIHTADLYLNGKSFYETDQLAKVMQPIPNSTSRDKEGATYTWYSQTYTDSVVIWANFKNIKPNKQLTELSIRKTCFYPDKENVNYLTISGFEFSQAATQWAAPTAEQIGMIATHWNKGWIIENNRIHDTKCSGITLGKERGTGQNLWSKDPTYDGSLHYIEVIFRVLKIGWNKDRVGSHIVKNNVIYNCEQTGICGSFGAAFSHIENNHIYNIYQKKQFTGHEMAGIKLHAAVDVVLAHNRIHDVGTFGYWMDWLTQGTRITKNVLYRNDGPDMYFEVNHGPYLADNNLMLSTQSLSTQSEGGAFVHNLINGSIYVRSDYSRYTPYLLPHATDVAGLSIILAGDDRYYNNIFVGKADAPDGENNKYGLSVFNKNADTKNKPDLAGRWPMWADGNVYQQGAQPYYQESNFIADKSVRPNYQIIEEKNTVYLSFTNTINSSKIKTQIITTSLLGTAKLPKQGYENPDGSPFSINLDYLGKQREANPTPGPFEINTQGPLKIKVWENKTH